MAVRRGYSWRCLPARRAEVFSRRGGVQTDRAMRRVKEIEARHARAAKEFWEGEGHGRIRDEEDSGGGPNLSQ